MLVLRGASVGPEKNERQRLDERSRAILDFERGWWQDPGPKEQAIRARLGLSPARYYQLLNRLIDSPEALRYDPMLVRRLRRLRTARRRQRFARDYGLGR
jgi:uncharacterized protein DUF3263